MAVLAEARVGHLDSLGGYEITSQSPVGARFGPDERKVLAWSRNPWSDIDRVGDHRLPHGRYVAGTTTTAVGELRVVAICIPWHMCDVRHDSKDRKPWEQHLRWLEYFGSTVLQPSPIPVLIAGDFNQRIPRSSGARRDVAEALAAALVGFEVATAGVLTGCDRQGVNHIAVDDRLCATSVNGWPHDAGGTRMSDHDGIVADFCRV